jgi:hypothetical protein
LTPNQKSFHVDLSASGLARDDGSQESHEPGTAAAIDGLAENLARARVEGGVERQRVVAGRHAPTLAVPGDAADLPGGPGLPLRLRGKAERVEDLPDRCPIVRKAITLIRRPLREQTSGSSR